MAEFEKDAADFKADLQKLGVQSWSVEEIADVIDYSASHVKNLLNGGKRYTPGARTKIGEMIAEKAAEPGMREQFDVDLPAEQDDVTGQKYELVNDANGDMCVVQLVATFKDGRKAQDYMNWLNLEAG